MNNLSIAERRRKFRLTQLNSNNPYEKKCISILLNMEIKFNPQKLIVPYIVDIYIPQKALVIELDGAIHNKKYRRLKDANREQFLISIGLDIVRYNSTKTDKTLEFFLKETLDKYPDRNKSKLRKIQNRILNCFNMFNQKGFEQKDCYDFQQLRINYAKFKARIKWKRNREKLIKKYGKIRAEQKIYIRKIRRLHKKNPEQYCLRLNG